MTLELSTPAGTPISKFSFGTMQWGGKADAFDSRVMYDAARSAGINFFDTAHGYTNGISEQLLGKFKKLREINFSLLPNVRQLAIAVQKKLPKMLKRV